MKYTCKKCQKQKEITKGTITYYNDEERVICLQAICCENYMYEIEEEFNGFPTIISNEPGKWKKENPDILESKK
mgnify:CR=1 FL=1